MRFILGVLLSPLLLAALSGGQVTAISGYASNWAYPQGIYAPFVPLVKTPSVSLDQPVMVAPQPLYATAPNLLPGEMGLNSYEPAGIPSTANYELNVQRSESSDGHFRLGAASFEDSYSVAQLLASMPKPGPSKHTYTNQDIENLNSSGKQVQLNGKTEPPQ
jgi:hypothetical protein